MPTPFPLVISPYELDARGVVADVALLLGQPTVTLLPAPFEGYDRNSISAAAATAPEFARLVGRWSWMQDLWRAGALRPDFAGIAPLDLVRETERSIRSDPVFAGLSGIMRRGVFDSTHEYLRALCRDIPLGGAEPAISVPVSVGLSRFAHAIDAPLVQQHARRSSGSIVQRLETRAARSLFDIALPLPRDVEPETVLALRAQLERELERLRIVLGSGEAIGRDELGAFEAALQSAIGTAAGEHDLSTTPRRGRRLSMVLLSSAVMPEDAPLAAALRASSLATRRRGSGGASAAEPSVALAPRPLRVLSVRELPWRGEA